MSLRFSEVGVTTRIVGADQENRVKGTWQFCDGRSDRAGLPIRRAWRL